MDQNHERRRGHFHRGRRGPDRRGIERRTPPQQSQGGRDQVDVEQIMRDIRARIAHRQGIDLSNQQIQDLAARRLESILDPRAIKPSLLEGLRRSAGAMSPGVAPKASSEPVYVFEHWTIYDSHRAILRFMRRLLNPVLKLFFNPNPLIRALHLQAHLNVEAAEREAERDRRQTEWNALHYEILQRVVTDVSRVSLEVQALSTRIESLNARVDFNDRRVRSMEGAAQAVRAGARTADSAGPPPAAEAAGGPDATEMAAVEGGRRRRRRRRGRRGGISPGDHPPTVPSAPVQTRGGQEPPTRTATEEPAFADADVAGGIPDSSEAVLDAASERREIVVVPAPPDPTPVPPTPLPAADEHAQPQAQALEDVERAGTDRSEQ